MLCFVTLKVRKLRSGWGSAPDPLAEVGPDLVKRKVTPLVSMYPLPNAKGVVGFGQNRGGSPPPPPQYSDLLNARGEWS